MLFSQRQKAAKEAEEWCHKAGAKICYLNCITALQLLGYSISSPPLIGATRAKKDVRASAGPDGPPVEAVNFGRSVRTGVMKIALQKPQ